MPAAKARTRHTNFTCEAFNELASEGLGELIENSATLEMKTLDEWIKDLKRSIGRVSDHRTGGDPAPALADGIGRFDGCGAFGSLED